MASDRPNEVYKQFFEENPDYGWSCEILLSQLVLRRIITIDELEFVASLTTHSQRTVAFFLGILPMKNKTCQLKFILVLRDLQEEKLRTYLEEKFKDLLPEAENLQYRQKDIRVQQNAQGGEVCPVERTADPSQAASVGAITKASLGSKEIPHLPPRYVTSKASSKQSNKQLKVHKREIGQHVHSRKCVVVGNRDAGKTSLLYSYTHGPKGIYVPTVFDNYTKTGIIRGIPYLMGLLDTTGQEDYDRYRPLSYPQTDVFLVLFSVISPSSFESVKEKWVPEISHHCPETPFLIVGTKIDLRNDSLVLEELARNNQKPVTVNQGEELARELRAVKYMECSAVTQEGLENVFDEAILATLEPPQRDNKKICSIS